MEHQPSKDSKYMFVECKSKDIQVHYEVHKRRCRTEKLQKIKNTEDRRILKRRGNNPK